MREYSISVLILILGKPILFSPVSYKVLFFGNGLLLEGLQKKIKMKKILILFLSLSVSLAFSQYKESDYHFYSNRTMLDRNFSNKRINISPLKSDFRPYRGIEMTYDESNTLFCLNNGYRSYGPDRDLSQIATLRWEENTCYDKKGLMVLKFQTGLTNSGYVEEMYYRSKDNRIIKSGLIGDFLFQSTTEVKYPRFTRPLLRVS